tara:strand:+ start:1 stop:1227 length:1227 start_codon:yes stop_codon:yes gene_type:complete
MILKNKLLINGLLAGVVLLGASITHAEVSFSESFDDQPDWNSGLPEMDKGGLSMGGGARGGWDVNIAQYAESHTLPIGWSLVRQTPSWSPSLGDPDRHETIEISSTSTAENPNRARGGTGKSFVTWRDSDASKGTNSFVSDGLLLKHYPAGFDQLYVEFWVNFSNETVATYYNLDYKTATTGLSKLFRIYHWDGTGNAFDYYNNNINPNMIWQFEGRPSSAGGYGFRNKVTLLTRRDRASSDPIEDARFLDSDGNYAKIPPTSYNSSTRAPYGGVAFEDKRDGGFIDGGAVDVDQVFGDETAWTKVAFFVKMNSAPGAFDGTMIQWIDDRKSMEINTVQWVSPSRDMVKWTTFGLGGNDSFNKYPDELRYEEWYAMDDIKVSNKIPDGLLSDLNNTNRPNSPLNITIE